MAKRLILGLGIMIILPMLVYHGVSIFVKEPKLEDYQIENYYELHKRASVEEQKRLDAEKSKKEKEYDLALRKWSRISFLLRFL